MNYLLRTYQIEAVNKSIDYINGDSKKRAIIISAMGSGKSLIIASIAARLNETVIVVQPNLELLIQNREKMTSFGFDSSVYSASLNSRDLNNRVIFATVGSIIKEAQQIKRMGVRVLIVDECALASKNGSQLSKFIQETGIEKVIGLSAFPIEMAQWGNIAYLKMINRSRKNIFQEIIHCTQVKEIIDGGFWTKMEYREVETDKSKLKLNSNQSDYTDKSLVEFYEGNNLKERLANEVLNLLNQGRKSILVFVPSIYEAEELSKLIRGAYAVSSKTPKKERELIINGFKNLQIQVVINVNICSYGFDSPRLDTILMGRPTNSFSLFAQQAGRGVRPHPDKKECLLIDYSGNISKFGRLESIEFRENGGRWGLFSAGQQLTVGEVEKQPKYNPNFDGKIWFGQTHKGRLLSECPTSYLQWIHKTFTADSPKVKQMLFQIEQILQKG